MSLLYALKPKKDRLLYSVSLVLHAAGVTPNMITAAGLIVSVVAAIVALSGHTGAGIVIFLLGTGLDILDGSLARASGMCTEFGRYFDSICDRLSESVFIVGAVLGGCTPIAFLAAGGSWVQLASRVHNHRRGLNSNAAPFGRPERLATLVAGFIAPSQYRPLFFAATGLLCLISSAVIIVSGQRDACKAGGFWSEPLSKRGKRFMKTSC